MFEIATGTRVPKFLIKSILVLEPIDMSAVYLSQNCGGIMRRADYYRHYAAECVRLARQTTNDNEKSFFLLQMAELWRRLADRARQQEQKKLER